MRRRKGSSSSYLFNEEVEAQVAVEYLPEQALPYQPAFLSALL